MAHPNLTTDAALSAYAERLLAHRGRLWTLWETLRLSIRGLESEQLPPQGLWRGLLRWFRAVVAPYYTGWLSAMVYAGAALLLFLVGFYRFTEGIGAGVVIAALVLEACCLLLLALASGIAPAQQYGASLEEFAEEVRSIATDIAHVADDAAQILERHEQLLRLWQRAGTEHEQILSRLTKLLTELHELPHPGAQLLTTLDSLRDSLHATTVTLQQLAGELRQWRQEQLQELIRQELTRLLGDRFSAGAAANPPDHE